MTDKQPEARNDITELRAALAAEFPREEINLAAVARLLDRLEAAERDARRLDWLDENPDSLKRATGYLGSASSWTVRDADGIAHDFASARAAIDAAMQSEKQA